MAVKYIIRLLLWQLRNFVRYFGLKKAVITAILVFLIYSMNSSKPQAKAFSDPSPEATSTIQSNTTNLSENGSASEFNSSRPKKVGFAKLHKTGSR